MAVLPAGYRPAKRLIFDANNNANQARVDVQTNGQITWHAGGNSHSWISLTGLNFEVDC